jgi:hypothetical protein
MNEYIIKCDDGDIVLDLDSVKIGCGVDLEKLDADLAAIDSGALDYPLPEDTTDYDAHMWESELGKRIGEVCACVDRGEEV